MLIRLLLYPLIAMLSLIPLSSAVLADTQTEETKAVKTILVWGDSLSAGYGIDSDKGWVNLLRTRLGGEVTVINASVSGETTQGGLTRLPTALTKHQPDLLILELGGNDGLRGLSPKTMKQNLNTMIKLAKEQQSLVLLLGMRIPPNYGAAYTKQFENSFVELAETHQIPFHPFFLEGIALNPNMMQNDGIHPNADAQAQLLENIWEKLSLLLRTKE